MISWTIKHGVTSEYIIVNFASVEGGGPAEMSIYGSELMPNGHREDQVDERCMLSAVCSAPTHDAIGCGSIHPRSSSNCCHCPLRHDVMRSSWSTLGYQCFCRRRQSRMIDPSMMSWFNAGTSSGPSSSPGYRSFRARRHHCRSPVWDPSRTLLKSCRMRGRMSIGRYQAAICAADQF